MKPSNVVLAAAAMAAGLGTSGCAFMQRLVGKEGPVEPVETEGFAGPVAKARQGQVVFAKQEIPRTLASEDSLARSFSLDDSIYLRGFMKDSFYNVAAKAGVECKATYPASADRLGYEVQVGDTPKKDWVRYGGFVPSGKLLRTTTTFSPAADTSASMTAAAKSWPKTPPSYSFLIGVVPQLRDGSNRITVRAYGACRGKDRDGKWQNVRHEVAKGTFELVVKPGDLERFAREKAPVLDPSPHPENAQLVALYEQTLERKWRDEVFVGAVTTSARWHVQLHPLHGRPTQRQVEARVVVRKKDQKRCRIFNLVFVQAYAGVGQQYHQAMDLGVGDSFPFPCHSAPKPPAAQPEPDPEQPENVAGTDAEVNASSPQP